jgi:hypothetical protein
MQRKKSNLLLVGTARTMPPHGFPLSSLLLVVGSWPFTFQISSIVRIAKEVCDILGLSNVTRAVHSLNPDEKNTFTLSNGIRGYPIRIIISEPGL